MSRDGSEDARDTFLTTLDGGYLGEEEEKYKLQDRRYDGEDKTRSGDMISNLGRPEPFIYTYLYPQEPTYPACISPTATSALAA